MLRNRNSFFQESNMSSAFSMPNVMPFQQGANIPYQASQASQSFYSSPTPFQNTNNFEDYENRLAKMERQLNRMDIRISKLENAAKIENVDITNSMYMV